MHEKNRKNSLKFSLISLGVFCLSYLDFKFKWLFLCSMLTTFDLGAIMVLITVSFPPFREARSKETQMTTSNIINPTILDAIKAKYLESSRKKGNENQALRSILSAKGIAVETEGSKLQDRKTLVSIIPATELKDVAKLFQDATNQPVFSQLAKAIEPEVKIVEPAKPKAPKAKAPKAKKAKMPLFVEDDFDFTKGLGSKQPTQAELVEQPTQSEIDEEATLEGMIIEQRFVMIETKLDKLVEFLKEQAKS